MTATLKAALYLLGALASALYLLNPGAGVFELLPDNLPLVGNLDEAAFVALLLGSLRGLRKLRGERRLQRAERLGEGVAGRGRSAATAMTQTTTS
jgi:uncharacterized membrane protein YkvA (DUF1232 family)